MPQDSARSRQSLSVRKLLTFKVLVSVFVFVLVATSMILPQDANADETAELKDVSSTFLINPSHNANQTGDPLTTPLKQLWQKTFPGNVHYSLLVGGRVFLASDNALYALDATTGSVLWGPIQGAGMLPTYDAGKIFTVDGWYADDGNHMIKAFSATSGEQLWAKRAPGNEYSAEWETGLSSPVHHLVTPERQNSRPSQGGDTGSNPVGTAQRKPWSDGVW